MEPFSQDALPEGVSPVILRPNTVRKALVPHDDVAPVVGKTSEVFSSASPPPSTCNGEADNLVAAASGAGASEYVEAPPTKTTRVSERGHSGPTVVTKELVNNVQTAADRGCLLLDRPARQHDGGALGALDA